jgi:endoglucanase
LWNASYTQSGEKVTVTNEPYNSSIAPGASVTVGFTGSYSSSNAAPAALAVNGTACST